MHHYLFDWGDTLMVNLPGQQGPMCDWPELMVTRNAVATLSQLSRQAKCHLATNARDSDEIRIRKALARVSLDQLIDRVFCYRSIGYPKPSIEYFDSVAKELSTIAGDMTMVGDDLQTDIIGARQCGLKAIWYNPGGASVPDGIVAIADLSELLGLAQQESAPDTPSGAVDH